MDKKEEECLVKDIQKLVHNELKQIKDMGISNANIDNLYKLIDIDKDIENINYWKAEKERYDDEIRRI